MQNTQDAAKRKAEDQAPTQAMNEVRLLLGLTMEAMAEELGCTLKTVWRCEAESRLPKSKAVLKNFHKLAKKAGVSVGRRDMAGAPMCR
jgi:DNA-binding XRE family transcriptional regulator